MNIGSAARQLRVVFSGVTSHSVGYYGRAVTYSDQSQWLSTNLVAHHFDTLVARYQTGGMVPIVAHSIGYYG